MLLFDHIFLRPIEVRGCEVDRMDPEAKRENQCILGITFCLFLPLSYGTLLAFARGEGHLKEPLYVIKRRFVIELILQGMLQSSFNFQLTQVKIRLTGVVFF